MGSPSKRSRALRASGRHFSIRHYIIITSILGLLLLSLLVLCPPSSTRCRAFPWHPSAASHVGKRGREHGGLAKTSGETCKRRGSWVFIKQMKAGSETLSALFRFYAVKHQRNLVIPRRGLYFGWPWPMNASEHAPAPLRNGTPYHILVDHAVYTHDEMRSLMDPEAVFLSVVREPFAQLASTFNYFSVQKITQLPGTQEEAFSAFILDADRWDTEYMSHAAFSRGRWGIPDGFSLLRNFQAHTMGCPTGFPPRSTGHMTDGQIKRCLERLQDAFALVLILERLAESLVLLKRMMCWSMDDLLTAGVLNKGSYRLAGQVGEDAKPGRDQTDRRARQELIARHKLLSPADYALYDHFSRELDRRVGLQDASFEREVAVYQNLQARVIAFCDAFVFAEHKHSEQEVLIVPAGEFHGILRVNCTERAPTRDASAAILRKMRKRKLG